MYVSPNDIDKAKKILIDKPHLGFLIIDSPLVSLKELKIDNEEIDTTFIERAMMLNMMNTCGQLIIIENKDLNYGQKCNYIEFGTNLKSRKAFFDN